jgi:hypothetical protein
MQRRTTWARTVLDYSLGADTNFATLDLLAAFKADGGVQQGVTVTRSHITLAVVSETAAGDVFSWGVLRGQNTDIGTNVAGAPTPSADPYDDWMIWRTETAADGLAQNHYWMGSSNVSEWDLKAQRRLEELQMTCNLVIQRISVAAASLHIQVAASVLLKLP